MLDRSAQEVFILFQGRHACRVAPASALRASVSGVPKGQHIICGRSHYAAKLPYLHSAIYTRLVDPGFLGEPVVIGLAD
jgi:hypothetical protein